MINIEKIVERLSKGYSLDFEFGNFSKIYLHTTENIKGFISTLDLKDKNVLSVAGSGDQLLNAYSLGCQNVDIFDINPITFCGVDLKLSAVKALSYEEFIHFFFREFETFFNEKTFEKIYPFLDQTSKELYETLFRKFGIMNTIKRFYYSPNVTLEVMKQMNIYLEESSYYELKRNVKGKKITFIETGIDSLNKKLKDKYDLMLFSNISDYINDIYHADSLEKFKELIYSLIEYLNLLGVIEVGYVYGHYFKGNNKSDFIDKEKRERVFKTSEFYSKLVRPYDNIFTKDKIIYYTKTR